MIDKLNNSPLNLQATSVYNFNEFSLTELLNKFFSTINQCVDSSNTSLEFLTWLKGEGLPSETIKELNNMYEDGRLTQVIDDMAGNLNNKIVETKEDINNKIENTKLELNTEILNVNTQLEQIALYPMKYDTENDYTNALNRVLAECDGVKDYIINLPQNDKISFSDITITKPKIKIKGGTIDKGFIVIDVPTADNLDGFVEIEDVRFNGVESGIKVITLKDGNIYNCFFNKCLKSIEFSPKLWETGEKQTIARIKIYDNYFYNTTYNLYSNLNPTTNLAIADIHFKNNVCKWAEQHLKIAAIDGLLCEGNTFFTKGNLNQRILEISEWFNWTIITNNQFFESGKEAIYLNGGTNLIISNNHFAWTGQITRSASIKIDNKTTTLRFMNAIISNNNFNLPSQTSIELINVDGINICNNMSTMSMTNNYYKGTSEIDTNKFKLVYIENTTDGVIGKISIKNNVFNLSETYVVNDPYMFLMEIDEYKSVGQVTTNVIDPKETVFIISGSSLSVDTINTANRGKTINIYSYGSNNTIVSGTTIKLKGDNNFTMNNKDTLTLIHFSNVWYEVSRSVNSNTIKSVTGTTLNVAESNSTYQITNSTATNFTGFTNGKQGQEVTLFFGDSNTTLVHSGTLILKGSANTTPPKNAFVTFYLPNSSNIWVEKSRSY